MNEKTGLPGSLLVACKFNLRSRMLCRDVAETLKVAYQPEFGMNSIITVLFIGIDGCKETTTVVNRDQFIVIAGDHCPCLRQKAYTIADEVVPYGSDT